jgi:hypothetical protein
MPNSVKELIRMEINIPISNSFFPEASFKNPRMVKKIDGEGNKAQINKVLY